MSTLRLLATLAAAISCCCGATACSTTPFAGGDGGGDPLTGDGSAVTGQDGAAVTCDRLSPLVPELHGSAAADVTLALDPAFAAPRTAALKSAVANEAALSFDDAATHVAGLLLSRPSTGGGGAPARAYVQDHKDGQTLAALPGLTSTDFFRGQARTTYDGYAAVTTQRLLRLDAAENVASLRDRVLTALFGHPAADVGVTPAPTYGAASQTFVLSTTTVARDDRVLLIGGLVPVAPGAAASAAAAMRLEDLTNGTALARFKFGVKSICDPLVYAQRPAADIVWLVDGSTSMADDRALIANHAERFFGRLSNAGVDFRVGVMRAGCGPVDVQLTAGRFTDKQAEFARWIEQPEGPSGCEDESPLVAGKHLYQALAAAPPVTQPGALSAGLRPTAQLIYLAVADEEERALQDDDLASRSLTQAQVAALPALGELLAFYRQRKIGVFGMVAQAPECLFEHEPSWAAQIVAQQTGGATWPICRTDDAVLSSALERLVLTAQGATARLRLSRVPISSSIAVWLKGERLARAAVGGFAYDAAHNAIVFNFAATHPLAPQLGDAVRVAYWSFENAPLID